MLLVALIVWYLVAMLIMLVEETAQFLVALLIPLLGNTVQFRAVLVIRLADNLQTQLAEQILLVASRLLLVVDPVTPQVEYIHGFPADFRLIPVVYWGHMLIVQAHAALMVTHK